MTKTTGWLFGTVFQWGNWTQMVNIQWKIKLSILKTYEKYFYIWNIALKILCTKLLIIPSHIKSTQKYYFRVVFRKHTHAIHKIYFLKHCLKFNKEIRKYKIIIMLHPYIRLQFFVRRKQIIRIWIPWIPLIIIIN